MPSPSGAHVVPRDDKPSSLEPNTVASQGAPASRQEILTTFLEAGSCLREVGSFVIRREAIALNQALTQRVQTGVPQVPEENDAVLKRRAIRTKRMSELLPTIEKAHEELFKELQQVLDGGEITNNEIGDANR